MPLHCVVSCEHGLFFSFHNAASNEHRPALLLSSLCFEPRAESSDIDRFHVILQVASDFHAVFERTHTDQALRVCFTLRQKQLRILKSTFEKYPKQKSPSFEAGEGPFGDARVRENHRNTGAAGFPQKIGPNLRFHHNHECRSNRPQSSSHRHHPIEREIKYFVGGL